MAGKGVIGGKIVIEGEKEYRAALKNITADQKELKSEMKLCTEEFKNNQNSSEALQKKYEVLTKQIESAKDKVKLYTDMYELAGKAQEQSAKKTEDLKEALAAAEKAMTQMTNTSDASKESIEAQQKEIDGLKNKLVSSQSEYDRTSLKIKEYKTSLNGAQAELTGLDRELQKTDGYLSEARASSDKCAKSIDEFGKQTKEASDKVNIFGDVLKANVVGDAIYDGLRKATTELKSFIKDGIEMASDLSESQNVVNVTFGESAGAIDDWAGTLATGFGMSILQGKQFAGTMGAMLSSMGFTNKATQDMSTSLVELAGDMASFYNLDAAEAFGKIRAGISGETEPLKQLGLNLSVANLEAYALANGITKVYKDMSQSEQVQLRYQYLMEATANAQGDFARTSEGYANQQRIFALQMDNLAIKIGKGAVPELERGIGVLNDSLENMDTNIEEVAGGITGGLVDGLEWVINNLPLVESGIAGVTSAVLVNKTVVPVIEAVNTLWIAHKTATEGAAVAQTALNVAQAASPVGIIVTALAGVTAALVTYALTAEKATSDTQKMIDKASESAAEFQKSIDSHNGAAKSIEAEAAHMRILSDELEKLNGKEKLSTNEKAKLTSIVNELNEAMPELNLAIDEQTGKLEGNTKELEANIDKSLEWYSVKAAQEELTAIYEDMSEAELELYKIDQQISEQNEAANAILKEKTGLAEEYNKQVADGVVVMDDYETRLNQLETKEADVNNVVKELTESKNQFNEVQKQGQEQIDILNGYIDENKSAMEANAEATAKAAENVITYKDAQVELKNPTEETIATIEALQQAYGDAKTAAQESISSQVGLFQELSGESDLSISEMKENLITQTETFTQYAEDLKTASAIMKADTTGNFAEIVSSLSDMGIDGAGYLHELVTAAEEGSEKFGEVMAAFSESKTAADTLAESMADIQTNYSGQMDELLGIHSSYNDEMLTQSTESAEEINEQIAKALEGMVTTTEDGIGSMATAVTQNSSKVVTAAEMLCTNVVSGTNKALGVGEDGKSEVFKKIGHNIPDSIATGVLSGQQLVTSAVQKVVNDAVASIDMSGLAAKVNRALGDAFS